MRSRRLPRCVAILTTTVTLWCVRPAIAQDGGAPSGPRPDTGAIVTQPAPPSANQPRSAWRDLFGEVWGDAKQLPSRRTAGWLAVGALAAGAAYPADTHTSRSLSGVSGLTEPLEPGAVIGSTPLQLGLSALTYGIGRSRNSPRMVQAGAELFRAQLLAQGLTTGMKASFRRERPEGGGFAFPSGHTTVSFASATVLQHHFGWRAGIPVYALASYVAVSRVQMKRHYLSDVAFGAALGIAIGRSVTIGRTHRLQVSPMATDGGGGVQFTWLGRGGDRR